MAAGFLVKLDSEMNYRWSKHFGGGGTILTPLVGTDPNTGNVLLGFNSPDPETFAPFTLPPHGDAGYDDVLVARFSP